jgi:hypothetical protein
MTMHVRMLRTARKAVARRHRVAVLSVGLGASLVLGTGVALAAAGTSPARGDFSPMDPTGSLPQVVKAQAEGQQKVAVAKAAEEAARKRAAAKAAADRRTRGSVSMAHAGPTNTPARTSPCRPAPPSRPSTPAPS